MHRVRDAGRGFSLPVFSMLFTALAVGNAYAADVNLSATGGNGKVDLSWAASSDIRDVQVMRDTDFFREGGL